MKNKCLNSNTDQFLAKKAFKNKLSRKSEKYRNYLNNEEEFSEDFEQPESTIVPAFYFISIKEGNFI